MEPGSPLPVKLISGVLYSDRNLCELAFEHLEKKYGAIDYKSKIWDFSLTDYYNPEMGTPIYRQFISFYELVDPVRLPRIKIECNEIEDKLRVENLRKVNLDPGYMDYDKFVLASAKYNAQKVYLELGIYADVTLYYSGGRFTPSPFCFPDFKSNLYEEAFLHMRAKYKGRLRKMLKRAQDSS